MKLLLSPLRRTIPWGLCLLLTALAPAAGQWHHRPVSDAAQEKPEAVAAIGKRLFVERCGRCHDEGGDKALASGPPLNERKLTHEGIVRAVDSRMRDKTDEDRRAVVDYIESFLKTKPSVSTVLRVEDIAKFG